MKDCINANITHAFYYDCAGVDSVDGFAVRAKKSFPDAVWYDAEGEMTDPYLRDMQTAEKFLHGGGQTYKVSRAFLKGLVPDETAGFDGWCVMLSYFPESSITSVSFHYALKNTTTDVLIGLRQSGEIRKYKFKDGEFSCAELAEKICTALEIPTVAAEKSYLCEITKIGDYDSIEKLQEEQAHRLYGFITGDEGYDFVPDSLVRDRLSHAWSSREFIRIYAFGQSFLFLNFLGSPTHSSYLDRQTQFGSATYGAADAYFFMGECPLTVNHGILFSVEFVMMLKALINNVLLYQSEYTKTKHESYYKRIRTTRDFRRKIIMVLEKVERTEISEIGELSAMLLESQHIAPIVDQVKYLLELLESDLSLIYSERNNVLVTILTVIGLLIAVWQVVLAF